MAFKPKAANKSNSTSSDNADRKAFTPIIPDDGLQAVQVGMLVNLGQHAKLPKFAKDQKGVRETDDEGNDKIIVPKEGSEEQKVAVYIDLLTQEHDYEGEIGVRNIRVPLHQVSRGMSEGINFVTVAPRDPKTQEYIKGRAWTLASTSQWYKIASVLKDGNGKSIKDIMFNPEYKNKDLNNIELLLGKPYMYNVEVAVTEKGENKYVNVKLKNAVPLMKGAAAPEPLVKAIAVNFDDEDLLTPDDELGGACKFDFIRIADLRKIVLATDYAGSNMQKAVQEKFDEKELIAKAKEIQQKIIESDKELQEVYEEMEKRGIGSASVVSERKVEEDEQEAPPAPKAKAAAKKKPAPNFDDMNDDVPF